MKCVYPLNNKHNSNKRNICSTHKTTMASAVIDTSDVCGSNVSLEMTVQDGKGAEDNQVVAIKDTASTLDITPSRRSSRKKQSTFSSDFEYYTPTGRKVEIEVEPGSTPRSKQTGKTRKQQSDDDESDEDVGSDNDDEEGKKSVKKKTNERKQKGKGPDDDDNDSGKWKTKVATKKKVKDGSVKKKQTNESSNDEDEDLSLKQFAGQKRKKVGVAVSDKRAKADDSSDEEDSTPISQLKAKIKQKKLEQKKPAVISSPRQNIMQMLVEDSANLSMSSSEKLPGSGQKRKVSTGDGDTDEGPTKGLKTIKLDKLAPVLANLVKQLPPLMNLGSPKQSPSKIMTNSSTPQKASLPGNASVRKTEEIFARRLSGKTETPTTPGSKPKVHADVPSRKLSADVDKSPKPLKPESEKTATKGDIHLKNEKAKLLGKNVKFDPKIKGEVRHVTKVQIIRKPDGTIVKRKMIAPERKTEAEDRSQKMKVSEFKNGDKQLSGLQKQKTAVDGQKLKVPVSSSSKNLQGQSVSPLKQKTDIDRAKVEGTGHKQDQGMKNTNSNAVKKSDVPRQTVDDLLKRGIVPKKKSHQPFGNKNVVKVHGKDTKSEAGKTASTKQEPSSNKPKINKPDSSMEVKKSKGSEKRRPSDSHKHSNGRRRSSESSKGERRKSSDSATKKSDKQGNNQVKEAEEDGPPVLIPASAVNKVKHKHHKTEHEVPIDMTMMDLFKPDNVIAEQQKKDEVTLDEKMPGSSDKVSQYTENTPDVYSFVKPENLHHILLEHMYSKPSSPVSPKQEGQQVIDSGTGRDDDIESVSHKQAVIMDVNLPDQILEESEEPVTEECVGDYQETWPDTMEELQLLVSRRDVGDRPSILESLDTELKEGGNEFRIVGQVEIERLVIPREENVLSLQSPTKTRQVEVVKSRNTEKVTEVAKSSTDSRKPSTDSRKSSTDKRRDSTDKKGHSSDRADSTSSGNDDLEMNKQKNMKLDAAERTQAKEGTESEDEEEEEHRYEDDEKDLDWEPNDADTVYCLCRKPHNNRFMICCDRCEEWYHGTCVGVTRAKGQEMEENEEEYICPVCIKGEKLSSLEKQATASKASDVPLVVMKPQKCVGRKCARFPRPGSVYCSNECIMSHAQESLKAIREEHMRRKSSEKHNSSKDKSSSSSKTSSSASSSMDTVEVIERQTGKVLTGSDAPTQKGLHRWLEQHPTFEVVQPHKHRGRSSSAKDKDVKSDKEKKHSSEKQASSEKERKSDQVEEVKHRHDSTSSRESERRNDNERHRSGLSQKSDSSSKGEERREDGPNQIRLSVRTALRDSLTARAQEASDIMLSGNEIKNLAVTIEEELYSMFSDTGHKYRTKYRSLVFNIKDQKNKGLFRKILTGKIKPHKLVLMSTEELASRELAKWREQASKHELEMIEKTEKEAMKERALTKHVRKKTHKGEVEVEDEDMSTLEIRLKEAQDPEPEPQEEQPQVPIVDTTDQHRAHLFDLNCKVCTGKIVPGPEEQATLKKILAPPTEPQKEPADAVALEEKEDFEKAEEIVKKAFQTMQKMEEAVTSMPKIVSSSPRDEEIAPPLSPKMKVSRRESSSSSSSSVSSVSRKQVVVRSPDSALQSGLEAKSKFTPTGPVLWKGFMSMLDVAKFFTSAYQVSGPTDYITLPDTVHILGRISPDHMWDYLSKIRQAGSKDLTVIRFIPGNDDEKIAYIHLYSYLNSRGRCGVAGNPDKQVKDFYIVPLASHSRIPRTLLPFDGPGFEENRPHMLIGILVRQRGKHGGDNSDTSSTGSSKSSAQGIVKSGSQSKTGSAKLGIQSSTGNSKLSSSTSTATKHATPPVNRDPRLAKFSARESSPRVSPADSSSSSSSSLSSNPGEAKPKLVEEYEPQYVKSTYKPVAEYIPTPTVKKKHIDREKSGPPKEDRKATDDSFGKSNRSEREKHHRHHHKKMEKEDELEDSDPYSPGKEAEAYSPGQEAAADEPYDPADDSLIDDTGIPIVSSTTVSTPKSAAAAPPPPPPPAEPPKEVAVSSKPSASQVESTAFLQKDSNNSTNELVEKMARSNDPQEISSLMVVALSAVSSSHQQQLLLVELTKKVEERKLQLAEAARRVGSRASSVDDSEKPRLDSEQQSSVGGSEGGGVTSGRPSASVQALNDASSNSVDIKTVVEQDLASTQSAAGATSYLATASVQPFSALGSASHSGNQSKPDSETSAPAVQQAKGTMEPKGIKFTISNPATKPQQALSSSASDIFTGENLESSKSKLPFLLEDTPLPQPPVTADSGNAGKSSGASGSSGDIPDALKALMDDVMGNTQFTSLEKRRKMLLQKEVKKEESLKESVNEESEIIEKQLTEQQGELQKKLISEVESKKDMDSRKLEQTGIDNKEGRDINTSDSGSDDSKPDPTETGVPSALTAAPSIDELLDRLKKGGFQFNVQKNENVAPSSLPSSSSSVAPIASQSSSTTSDDIQFVESSSYSATSSAQHATLALTSLSSVTSVMDIDLRQSSGSPFPAAGATSGNTNAVEANYSRTLSYKDYAPGVSPAAAHDQDDRTFYKDQDDRLYRPTSLSTPKHPLDPHAFPPLPGEPRNYLHPPPPPPPPPPSSTPPRPHGPLHPRFPLPPTMDQHVPYHPTPRAALLPRNRMQPMPPGMDPAGASSITSFQPDLDFRNRNRPPALLPHQALPPLPSQSPPPLPLQPPPGIHSTHFPHPSEDMDYRPQPSHRQDYYSQGRGRSFH